MAQWVCLRRNILGCWSCKLAVMGTWFRLSHMPPIAGTSLAMNAAVNVAAAFPGWVRGIGAGQPDDDGLGGSLGMGGGPSHMMGLHMGCEEADDLEIPPESLSTLQEFNAQLSKVMRCCFAVAVALVVSLLLRQFRIWSCFR